MLLDADTVSGYLPPRVGLNNTSNQEGIASFRGSSESVRQPVGRRCSGTRGRYPDPPEKGGVVRVARSNIHIIDYLRKERIVPKSQNPVGIRWIEV